MTNPVERVVRPIDRWQQRHRPFAFAFGVIKKFGDDRGGMLGSLVAYYGFLSMFPLLLLAFTILGYVLAGNPSLQDSIKDSALAQFPIIGAQLGENIHTLNGSGLALVVGLLGLAWGGTGVAQAVQFALQEVWDVPNRQRPSFVTRMFRSLLFFAILGLGVLLAAAPAVLSGIPAVPSLLKSFGVVGSLIINVGLYLLVFKILSPKDLRWGDLLPGAVLAGAGWTMLQTFGTLLVSHQLRHTQQAYGTFGLVLGLFAFLALGSQLTVYAAEVNAVRKMRLWPRSIIQPPLTEADRRALVRLAKQEERRPGQRVAVRFEADGSEGGSAAQRGGDPR